tara:strand:- start:91 stop:1590 length:1500 start_codon:yes stop_codon:yes gene_type:complete
MGIRDSIRQALLETCFYNPSAPPTFGDYGCMDPAATNYESTATHPCNNVGPNNNPSPPGCADCFGNTDHCGPGTYPGDCCVYPPPNYGCIDSTACNYDAMANTDDGSCDYTSCLGCTDNSACNTNVGALIDDGSCTYPGCNDQTANNYDPSAGCPDNSCVYNVFGCTDPTANNYNPMSNVDDNSCVYDVFGCTDSLSNNYNSSANIDDGSCEYEGCTDVTANNYDATATIDDGTCNYDVYGCTDPGACNTTKPTANIDDGSCEYTSCVGCTDPQAINYDNDATIACQQCCVYPIAGCTDSLAFNYDPLSTVDDGSCIYDAEPGNCSNQLDIGCWVCKDPINFPGCQKIVNMNQVTLATSYGLTGFDTQQGCIDSTECGNGGPCDELEDYVLVNYPSWQGGGPLDVKHFCEKCKYNGLNDPLCKCCKKDPCDKVYVMDKLQQVYNLELPEFCKYCKNGDIKDISCKCCKRFQKDKKKKRVKKPKKDRMGEEIKRIKELLK